MATKDLGLRDLTSDGVNHLQCLASEVHEQLVACLMMESHRPVFRTAPLFITRTKSIRTRIPYAKADFSVSDLCA